MNQIYQINELQRQGYGPGEIASRLRIDRKTVRTYMKREDFNESLEAHTTWPSKLDRWKPLIDEWLAEDQRMRFKQRHTAKRIHQRLCGEHAGEYDCSYPLVQRYVKAKKVAQRQMDGFLELVWAPGEAQADFGEAEVMEAGVRKTIKYLTLSFPYSNAGFTQVFEGETAECVAQGLQDIFGYLGGVPRRIVFDNATGVGRKIQQHVALNQLFLRFKCHYGFSVSFCNPNAGHEKGNVENKIGYTRRNFFVPLPVVDRLVDLNMQLFKKALQDHARKHYKKGQTIAALFAEEQTALSPLPARPFNVERYERLRTDGYGKFCLDGKHWYSSAPEYASGEVTVGIKAREIVVYGPDGEVRGEHRRIYGEERSDSIDWHTSIAALMHKPSAWQNSHFRAATSPSVRQALDALPRDRLRDVLKGLVQSSERFGFEVALASLEEAVSVARLDSYSVHAVAARHVYDGLYGIPAAGPDLGVYDRAFIGEKEHTP
jgi:transposase